MKALILLSLVVFLFISGCSVGPEVINISYMPYPTDQLDLKFEEVNISFTGWEEYKMGSPGSRQKTIILSQESIEKTLKEEILTLSDLYSTNLVDVNLAVENYFWKAKEYKLARLLSFMTVGVYAYLFGPLTRLEVEATFTIEILDHATGTLIYRDNFYQIKKQLGTLYFGKNIEKMMRKNFKRALRKMKEDVIENRDDILTFYRKIDRIKPEIASEPGQVEFQDDFVISDIDVNIPRCGANKTDAVAVIIGNQNYQHVDVPDVDNAINDARIMKEYLVKVLGYNEENIIYQENAGKAELETFFGIKGNHQGKLFNWMKPGESEVFIYYVGHGAPDVKSKQGYFVPVNADPSTINLNGYSLETFSENIALLPYKSITVVIDACFSGVSESGLLIKSASPVGLNVSNPFKRMKNARIFLSSSDTEVSSWYNQQGHSLFTYYFLKGLKGEADSDDDGCLTFKELSRYIMDNVPYKARRLHNREQTPQAIGDAKAVIVKY